MTFELAHTKRRGRRDRNGLERSAIMEWIANNWIWILLIGGFLALHKFGGGCCGGGEGDEDAREKAGNPGFPRAKES